MKLKIILLTIFLPGVFIYGQEGEKQKLTIESIDAYFDQVQQEIEELKNETRYEKNCETEGVFWDGDKVIVGAASFSGSMEEFALQMEAFAKDMEEWGRQLEESLQNQVDTPSAEWEEKDGKDEQEKNEQK